MTPVDTAWFSWVLSNVQVGLLVLGEDLRVVYFNDWFAKRSGLQLDAAEGQPVTALFPDLDGSGFTRSVATALRNGTSALLSNSLHPTPLALFADERQRAAGERIQQTLHLMPMKRGQAGERHVLVQVTDVSAAVAREQQLRQQAADLRVASRTDSLTGLANRRHLDAVLDTELRRAVRSRKPVALILFDVDYFKSFNDAYGHPAGDKCLQHMARAMQAAVGRPSDLVARYGGEEFAVLLPETAEEGALEVAERIRVAVQALEIPHATSRVSRVATISAGVAALVPPPGTENSLLLAHADSALYAAKGTGRNRCCRFDHMPIAPVRLDSSRLEKPALLVGPYGQGNG